VKAGSADAQSARSAAQRHLDPGPAHGVRPSAAIHCAYTAGQEARDVFIERNACSASTVPVGGNGCVEYKSCSAGKPVLWCGTPTGGHWYPAFSAKESKTFFDRF